MLTSKTTNDKDYKSPNYLINFFLPRKVKAFSELTLEKPFHKFPVKDDKLLIQGRFVWSTVRTKKFSLVIREGSSLHRNEALFEHAPQTL